MIWKLKDLMNNHFCCKWRFMSMYNLRAPLCFTFHCSIVHSLARSGWFPWNARTSPTSWSTRHPSTKPASVAAHCRPPAIQPISCSLSSCLRIRWKTTGSRVAWRCYANWTIKATCNLYYANWTIIKIAIQTFKIYIILKKYTIFGCC